MSDDQESGWGLVLSFSGLYPNIEQERAFTYGFEAGQIWMRMKTGTEGEIDIMINEPNRVIVERMCAAEGWDVQFSTTKDETGIEYPTYLDVKMQKRRLAKPNPHGLRVVTQ